MGGDTIDRMVDFAGWGEHAREVLRRSGHRGAGPRGAVIELLARQQCCMSAQEVFDRLRAEGRSVGIATVYRVLDLLAQHGLVQRLELGVSRYEPVLPSGEHHHHLVCNDCGRVEPFADAPLERALARVSGDLGYEIGGHDVVLRGSCGDCRPAA